jgi:hypothetical protein
MRALPLAQQERAHNNVRLKMPHRFRFFLSAAKPWKR